MLYEDFADAMYTLMREVTKALPNGDAATVLHEAFNDQDRQNYIIVYLRVRLMVLRSCR